MKSVFKLAVATLMFIAPPSIYAQLKVSPSGQVTVAGTSPYSSYQLSVQGYPGIVTNNAGYYVRVSSASANGVIGSNTDKLAFWTGTSGHNKVWFQDFTKTSDSCRKENIVTIENALEIIDQLNPTRYDLRMDSLNFIEQTGYGFVAQEMQTVLPEIVDTNNGVMGIRIDEIIPFLVGGMQEQQLVIDSLLERVTELEKCECKIKKGKSQESSLESGAAESIDGTSVTKGELYQNQPNPFREKTVIKYTLPDGCSSASIIIFDMSGALISTYEINVGDNQRAAEVEIDGGKLKPGMYIYSLIVDGAELDTKRMILHK